MTAPTATTHVPPALITHCVASIRGRQDGDISVCHARTTDARIAITFGGVLMVIYSCLSKGSNGLHFTHSLNLRTPV